MRQLTNLLFLIWMVMGCSQKMMGGNQDNDFLCEFNKEGDYKLCIKESAKDKKNMTTLFYYLADKQGNKVMTGELGSGEVAWLGDYAVEIYRTPGNISKDLSKDDITKVYLIKEDRYISKTEYLKQCGECDI